VDFCKEKLYNIRRVFITCRFVVRKQRGMKLF